MIARIWHGETPADQADAYFDYLNSTSVAECSALAGNRGVYVLRRLEGPVAHFLLVTFWDSEASIKKFAGPDPKLARYYPQDKKFLLNLEPAVDHYEVLA
jgi:heme-degrading monooxygenase HmoA